MKTPEEKSIQLKYYDVISLNQTIAELRKWVNQPYPETYSAGKSQFVQVMRIIQNRRYTLIRRGIEQQDSHAGKELMDRQDAIVRAGASLCENYTEADDEIFKYLDGRSGPVPGYGVVMEAYHGSPMDNLGKDIRRFRQSVSDLITELQNVIEKSGSGEAKTEQMSRRQDKGGQVEDAEPATPETWYCKLYKKTNAVFRRIPYWIYTLTLFLAALLTCLYYLGWLEPIELFIYKLFTHT